MKLNKLSLKWKLFFYILLFAAVIILIFCVFQILLLDKVYKSTKIRQTEELMDNVAEVVSSAKINDLNQNDSNVVKSIKEFLEDAEAEVYLFRRDEVINDSLLPEVTFNQVYPKLAGSFGTYRKQNLRYLP